MDEGPFIEAFSAWVRDHVATHVPFVAEVDGDAVGMAWLMVADRVPNSDPQRGSSDFSVVRGCVGRGVVRWRRGACGGGSW